MPFFIQRFTNTGVNYPDQLGWSSPEPYICSIKIIYFDDTNEDL